MDYPTDYGDVFDDDHGTFCYLGYSESRAALREEITATAAQIVAAEERGDLELVADLGAKMEALEGALRNAR